MREPRITLGKAVFLMLGIGTVSLMGIPGMSSYRPPAGALTGHVVDGDGAPVAGVPVALFDAHTLSLAEVTHTDERGRYGLQQTPEAFHLLARPEPGSGLAPRWRLGLSRDSLQVVDLVTPAGEPLRVRVADAGGTPLAGAEVRAYDVGPPRATVVARAWTDENGHAELVSPRRAHVGVFAADPEELPVWRFDLSVPAGGLELAFSLPRGRRLHGRVLDGDRRPLEGIVVSSWDRRDTWQWNGYRLSAPDGSYAIHAGAGAAEVRARDRRGKHLPARRVAGPTPLVDLDLPAGSPLRVVCRDAEGGPLPSRVWLWSAETEAWSWGLPTGDDGRLATHAGPLPRAAARALHRPPSAASRWASEPAPGELTLVRTDG